MVVITAMAVRIATLAIIKVMLIPVVVIKIFTVIVVLERNIILTVLFEMLNCFVYLHVIQKSLI